MNKNMMYTTGSNSEKRVLVVAPSGCDANVLCRVLEDAGMETASCETAAELCCRIDEGAAAAIIADEALAHDAELCLASTLAEQPEWSDFPLIVMTSQRREYDRVWSLLEKLNGSTQPILLERPVSTATLIRTVRAVFQSRIRQYQIRDEIAERKRLENELVLKVEQLAESDRRKDEFLAMLGHELRNPLAAIVNGIEVLPMLGPLSPEANEVCQMLARQSKQMTHLIDDLLDISRISRGSVRLRIERIDLVDLIRQVADEHRAALEGGSTLELSLPERLPINGDPTRLRQIFGNLIHNACKFTNPGGQITIAAHGNGERQMAHVAVRDTGVGMSAEFLTQLFEPFKQDEASRDRSRGGLGLGLALVKGLVELHGGAVTAHSSGLGKGSEFTVSLPLANNEDARCNRSDVAARTSNRPAFRILLVEDAQPVAEIFSLILRQMGHQHVEIAPNAVEALDRIPIFRPQIVFSDISMAGMSGYELAQRIRQHPQWNHLVLVALTGLGQPDDCQQARQAGFDYHLVKPADVVQIETLFDEIANQVQG